MKCGLVFCQVCGHHQDECGLHRSGSAGTCPGQGLHSGGSEPGHDDRTLTSFTLWTHQDCVCIHGWPNAGKSLFCSPGLCLIHTVEIMKY